MPIPARWLGGAALALAFAACGDSYGTAESTDGGSPETSAPPMSESGVEPGIDSGPDAADASADADGAVAIASPNLSNACLRAPPLPLAPAQHIIGVYNSPGALVGGRHVIDVKVQGATPVTLVLSSYEKVNWKVALDPGASVAAVYLYFVNNDSVVTGLPASIAVTKRVGYLGYGFTGDVNPGYGLAIASLRSDLGQVETTAQFGSKASFTVGGAVRPSPPDGYDTREPCTNKCATTSGLLAWSSMPSSAASVSPDGLTATLSSIANLRTTRGLKCGKHYFEIDSSATGLIGALGVARSYGLDPIRDVQFSSAPGSSMRVGVSLDLDAGTVHYTYAVSGSLPPPQTLGPRSLDLWYWEEIGPHMDANGNGTVKLITRAPFAFTRPTGYAADL